MKARAKKTGWTYIRVAAELAGKLMPGNKKSFRVKGKLDAYAIKGVALIPMGEGDFIMAVNAVMRKAIGKKKGAIVKVQLELDKVPYQTQPGLYGMFERRARSHCLF